VHKKPFVAISPIIEKEENQSKFDAKYFKKIIINVFSKSKALAAFLIS
jgi:hypothetical protein